MGADENLVADSARMTCPSSDQGLFHDDAVASELDCSAGFGRDHRPKQNPRPCADPDIATHNRIRGDIDIISQLRSRTIMIDQQKNHLHV